ncbi:MAG: hypothetical protein KIT25_06480 [Enhydrobacter sp.]|nr:MAG: hypothetical protein KIT25_06480 [Enhydrobacter sp.]
MGEAKRRRTRLQRMLAEQPWCIYCGGSTPGSSVDHMPPIAICDLRQRPPGLEFVACADCHEATRRLDQVAAVLCRAFPDPTSEDARREVQALMRGLANNQPDILFEWRASAIQRRIAYEAPGQFKRGGALNIGDKTHMMMLTFAARTAAALHFQVTQRIVPSSGGIWATWHTNERLIKGDFPEHFAEMLPPHTTLGAGLRKSLAGQFDYSSRVTDDGLMSAHMATFRLSFAIQAAVATDIASFAHVQSTRPALVFRPGFLKKMGQ